MNVIPITTGANADFDGPDGAALQEAVDTFEAIDQSLAGAQTVSSNK